MRTLSNNFLRLREVNTDLVRTILKSSDACTKAGLAAATGLSIATCGNILADLLATGEVMELELGSPEGGRPPRLYGYAPGFALSLLLFPKRELGADFLVYAVIDAKGGTVAQAKPQVEAITPEALDAIIFLLREKYPNIKTIAVSIPGLVQNGVVGFCDIEALEGMNVEGLLADRHNLPVRVDNDMNLAALGYMSLRGEGAAGVVYLAVPQKNCTGAGIVVNGQLLRGKTSFAGELSFLPHGPERERQIAGLSPEEALEYTAELAATVVPVINPGVLVVASERFGPEALDVLRQACLRRVPAAHLPDFVLRRSTDEDCLAGLASLALAGLGGKVRLVENVGP